MRFNQALVDPKGSGTQLSDKRPDVQGLKGNKTYVVQVAISQSKRHARAKWAREQTRLRQQGYHLDVLVIDDIDDIRAWSR